MAIKLRGINTQKKIMYVYAYQKDWIFSDNKICCKAALNIPWEISFSLHPCVHFPYDDDVWWCSNTNANLYVKTYDRKCERPLWASTQKRYSKKSWIPFIFKVMSK
jgi:hypothetical protein